MFEASLTLESVQKEIRDLLAKVEKLDPNKSKWSPSEKQKILDSINKIQSHITELEATENPAREFFKNHYINGCNKELLTSILVILCKNHSIHYTRADTRYSNCAFCLFNKHWDIFKPDLDDSYIDPIKDPITEKINGYEVNLLGQKFYADSKGKIGDIHKNKRSPKCDQVREIEIGIQVLIQFLENNANTQDQPSYELGVMIDVFPNFVMEESQFFEFECDSELHMGFEF